MFICYLNHSTVFHCSPQYEQVGDYARKEWMDAPNPHGEGEGHCLWRPLGYSPFFVSSWLVLCILVHNCTYHHLVYIQSILIRQPSFPLSWICFILLLRACENMFWFCVRPSSLIFSILGSLTGETETSSWVYSMPPGAKRIKPSGVNYHIYKLLF